MNSFPEHSKTTKDLLRSLGLVEALPDYWEGPNDTARYLSLQDIGKDRPSILSVRRSLKVVTENGEEIGVPIIGDFTFNAFDVIKQYIEDKTRKINPNIPTKLQCKLLAKLGIVEKDPRFDI